MSRRPTTAPRLSSTGKWRNRFSTIMSKASSAGSSVHTHLGFFVITSRILVDSASTPFDTTRRVTSLSVKIPESSPRSFTSNAASTRFDAIVHVAASMVMSSVSTTGTRGCNFVTGRCLDSLEWRGFGCDTLTGMVAAAAPIDAMRGVVVIAETATFPEGTLVSFFAFISFNFSTS